VSRCPTAGTAAIVALVGSLSLGACSGEEPFKAPVRLGGKLVQPALLNAGRVAYWQYCRACHGDNGDGKGPAAPGLRPPPRDFRLGVFKFAGVLDQKLPRDQDLARIVRAGLHGTAMLGWDVPPAQLDAVIQYLKTLSPKWRLEDAVGEPVVAGPDPWGEARKQGAIARGKLVYHGFAQCIGCHPAYATRRVVYDAYERLLGGGTPDLRDALYQPELKESEYGIKVLAPDFLVNELRSIEKGTALQDLYRIIVAGVTGAAMPAWSPSSLPEGESDVWALAYYVRSLMELRGTPRAAELRRELARQPPLVAPPE
jgi:mono/diheme cytochrome c family protein